MSRKVVNLDFKGFHQKAMNYDWKKKVGTNLPDNLCTVVSSVLFMPLANERGIESPTVRAMAWFSAAVSSGIPLVFVNIQSEQIITSTRNNVTSKELTWGKQQNTAVNIVQGIRLWFLPGVAEETLELFPQSGETRYGMDIRQTDEDRFLRDDSKMRPKIMKAELAYVNLINYYLPTISFMSKEGDRCNFLVVAAATTLDQSPLIAAAVGG
ncbi:unnamed protein product [Fraxinus pennsylvanica]|uniref:Uncharacterized protein n=1 Tax=Fraxinus pennsylvanica TaxID=56036 RepID=A0AAD1YQL4_9LAMI|nr:unnamed protein product [Fraxinus pennsylvanica]